MDSVITLAGVMAVACLYAALLSAVAEAMTPQVRRIAVRVWKER